MSYTSLGQIAPLQSGLPTLWTEPPIMEDEGITRIPPDNAPAFIWSIDWSTTSDPNLGTKISTVPGYLNTKLMDVASGPGDQWLSSAVQAGGAVLLQPVDPGQLKTWLTFAVTYDPQYIADMAGQGDMILVDGSPSLIQAAKALLTGGPPGPPVEPPGPGTVQCPEGQQEVYGICTPIPGYTPPDKECPAGQMYVPGMDCVPIVGWKPPGTPPTEEPPPEKPVAKAETEIPDWALPVALGVGAVAVLGIWAYSRRGARR